MRRYEALRIIVYLAIGFLLFYVLRATEIWAYIPETVSKNIGRIFMGFLMLLMLTPVDSRFFGFL